MTKPKILVVCDIQENFMDFINEDLFNRMKDYVSNGEWEQVITIVDTNTDEALIPDWLHGVTTTLLTKRYGHWHSGEEMAEMGLEYEELADGTFLELDTKDLYIPVSGTHEWFAIPDDFRRFFLAMQGQEVALIGGAENECLQDTYDALEYLGVTSYIESDCCFSASTRHNDTEWYKYDTNWVKVY